jgi:hypothetical protein
MDLDVTTMCFDEGFGDEQAESRSLDIAAG